MSPSAITKEGNRLPIYNQRHYIRVKSRNDFRAFQNETNIEIINQQFQLAEDSLDSLIEITKVHREWYSWENDPVGIRASKHNNAHKITPAQLRQEALYSEHLEIYDIQGQLHKDSDRL